MDTIRIFVGCSPNFEDAESEAVLEYTLRKYASRPVEITWMRLSRDPASPFCGWRTERWPTPFSGFRWAVPALCNFEGRAIYTDSDVIFRSDAAHLWDADLHGMPVMAKASNRLCVSLWDCASPLNNTALDALRSDPSQHAVMSHNYSRTGVCAFPGAENWNCLDGENYADIADRRIRCIHMTSMAHQCHLKYALPRLAAAGLKHWFDGKPTPHWRLDLQALFDEELASAIAAGFTVESYCAHEPYGDYDKASVASLRGAVPHWGQR